ncbi:DUF5776 domain-containing protein [Rummeliibacillus sp. NPDC094406]|uniref:DUF5776 domain-containing protein n=1 Tax=Rummeliibacillus sp. NPDC094406 TaxID=3364511 RepID=UPI00380E6004
MSFKWMKSLAVIAVIGLGVTISHSNVHAEALESPYYNSNPKIVKVKSGIYSFKDVELKEKDKILRKGSYLHVKGVVETEKGTPRLQLTNGQYITANKQFIVKTKGYQNPKQYFQVQYEQIKPTGKVGYNLSRGYEGIKTWKVMRRLGIIGTHGYAKYNNSTYYAVRNFQAKHKLPVTGNVDLKTWIKLGFSENSWYNIDNYIAPLKANGWDGRSEHIEAMIRQAYKYIGNPYIVGAASSPSYGLDCSGLVTQALYAGGINPVPVSSIQHAHPGNEWNSRKLFASKQFKHVPYSQRQRGDLIFYYQPGTHTIWHVAIYLGNNKIIESWPTKVMISPVINSHCNVIAGVTRPFL